MSSLPRLFLPSLSPNTTEVPLEGASARYLLKVLRKKEGDPFLGIDDQGREYDLALRGDAIHPSAKVVGVRAPKGEEVCSIVLAQGLPKGTKMDSILRQCTEVGVDRFIPLLTKRCVSRPQEERWSHKAERWGKILLEACRQSGRVSIPALDPVTNWSTLLSAFKEFDLVLMPYEKEAPALGELLDAKPGPKNILILIGPEGGWAPDEVWEAEQNGAFPTHLPTPILRTETAGLVTTAMLRFTMDRSPGSREQGS